MLLLIFIAFLVLLFHTPALSAGDDETTAVAREPGSRAGTAQEAEEPGETVLVDKSGDRDPFATPASGFIKPDFDKAAASCRLKGIVKAGNLIKGLFAIDKPADNPTGRQLLVKMPGDAIVIMVDRQEYRFTIKRFGSRSVKLIDENNKTYEILL